MNKFNGIIKKIEKHFIFNLITIKINNEYLQAICLQLNENFKEHCKVAIFFKETEIYIAKKNDSVIGAENILKSKIIAIKKGDMFSEIIMKTPCGEITVILTNLSLKNNELSIGEQVYTLIKANDISLSLNLKTGKQEMQT